MRPEPSSQTFVIVSRPGGAQVFGRPGSADARGRYRITGLPPGEYLVSVLSLDPTMSKTEVHFTDPAGQDRILSPGSVFYPGVPTASQASKVTVTEGGEAMGVDLTVRPVPMTQITVTATASRPVREIQLQQIQIEEPLPTLEKEIWMTGTTVTLDASPGRYRLLAFAEVALNAETAVRLWASAEVDTDPSIPAAVDMHLEPGANISGRIVFEGTESNRQNAEARLAPVSPLRFLPANKRLPHGREDDLRSRHGDLLNRRHPARPVCDPGGRRRRRATAVDAQSCDDRRPRRPRRADRSPAGRGNRKCPLDRDGSGHRTVRAKSWAMPPLDRRAPSGSWSFRQTGNTGGPAPGGFGRFGRTPLARTRSGVCQPAHMS